MTVLSNVRLADAPRRLLIFLVPSFPRRFCVCFPCVLDFVCIYDDFFPFLSLFASRIIPPPPPPRASASAVLPATTLPDLPELHPLAFTFPSSNIRPLSLFPTLCAFQILLDASLRLFLIVRALSGRERSDALRLNGRRGSSARVRRRLGGGAAYVVGCGRGWARGKERRGRRWRGGGIGREGV
ncbi:hypothetical protein C8Q73DRAFT_16158 [Cubamyces lactineus]|nr:hypothetical protein C8Q73DRAFT_16158 [Cubamyces lactineus]